MEWDNILTVLITLLALGVGIPLVFRNRKKGGSRNVAQFLDHLQSLGVRANLMEKGTPEENVGVRKSFSQRSEGVIRLDRKDIDYINLSSVSSQYGVNYYLDYLVEHPVQLTPKKSKKTKLTRKRSPALWGQITDITWRGDDYLASQLNLDYQLKDMLMQANIQKLKSGIDVIAEPKHGYARIRTNYLLPTPALLRALEMIAHHIKAGYW